MVLVVVDNDPAGSARVVVAQFAATAPFQVYYVHEPRRGIARARNAAVDRALELGADWIAMLDDDETADRRWLANLMVEEYRHIPVLMGHRIWVYPEPRPFWAPDGLRKTAIEGAKARHHSTSNVRFSAELLHAGLRFDEGLGLAGGEDQRFFDDAAGSGFAIHATNRALTYEAAHRERLTYRFMIARHYGHIASVAFRRRQDAGVAALLRALPMRLLDVPLGIVELAISPIARLFGRRRFKQFALRGGKRVAGVVGTIAASLGHLPQSYRRIAGR